MRRPLLVLAVLAAVASTAAVVGSAATLDVHSASIDTFDSATPASTTTSTTTGGDTTPPTFVKAEYFDTNTNGRLDRIVVTYSEPLGQAGTGSNWTIANRPSGMGTAAPAVTIAGSAVHLDVTEATSGFGTGPTNLQVSVAAAIVKDLAGNPAAALTGQVVADKAGPVPVSLTIANRSNGGTAGKPEEDDTVTIQFSEALAAASVCPSDGRTGTSFELSANNTGGNGNGLFARITDGSPETLTVGQTSVCGAGLRWGSVTLGAAGNYVNADVTFEGNGSNTTTLELTTAGVLKLQFGTGSGQTDSTPRQATYTPHASIADPAGNLVAGTVSSTALHF